MPKYAELIYTASGTRPSELQALIESENVSARWLKLYKGNTRWSAAVAQVALLDARHLRGHQGV